MYVNDVSFGGVDGTNHPRANRRGCQLTEGTNPQNLDASIENFGGSAVVAGDNNSDVSKLLQLTTKVSQMGFHSARMRRVELSDLKHL